MGRNNREQRCVVCKDPLGDSEAMVVTGRESKRQHFVHRPTTIGRALCFTYGTYGADVQSIALKAVEYYDDAYNVWDIHLASQMGLDRIAVEAVGLRWRDVRAAKWERR